jgi:S-(hydroxymethyl)mycothiol dehydrogenase
MDQQLPRRESGHLSCGTLNAVAADESKESMVSQSVRGVVARGRGEAVQIETIVIPDPGPHDVVVRIQACGVCHTDLHYREGGINDEFPFLLGHEAAGIVEEIGDAVESVEVGDFVVLNWRAVCGRCRACKRGRPWYCFDTFNASKKMTLEDGTELTPALGIGAFAEKTLVHAGQCTKVDQEADPAVVGLLGCGVMAGLGAAMNTGNVGRGDTVAVIGCGGVGCGSIAGARLAGASKIIAVDLDQRKLDWATELGATHTVLASDGDAVQAIQDLTDGFGVDVVIDAVGRPETWKQAFYARDLAGTVVLVGVPTPDMKLEMPLIDFFSHGGSLKSSWYGDCLPERDFPMLVDLYQQGRLPLEKFVTERISLDEVENAFATMHAGAVLRSVVVA